MRAHFRTAVTAVALLAATFAGAGLAEAKCKRMGFLVNDYGKDGPARDAQALLDKHVEKWAAENGITNYTIGKKDVSCELYLNLILFDEHTCTASANVCWDEPGTKKKESSSAKSDKSDGDAAKAAQNDKKDDKTDGSASKAAESDKAEAEAVKAADAPKTDKSPAPVETGAVPATPAANDAAANKPAVDPDAAERAAAAAERAAEAAERAAAAAERAAEATKAKEATASTPPSQMEMPSFGAGSAASATSAPAAVEPVKPATPAP